MGPSPHEIEDVSRPERDWDQKYSPGLDYLWRFVANLHAAVAPNEVVQILAQESGRYLEHEGLRYQNHPLGLYILSGAWKRHCCSFRLISDGDSFGELTFFRSRPFMQYEIELLESLTSLVRCPLYDAVHRYRTRRIS